MYDYVSVGLAPWRALKNIKDVPFEASIGLPAPPLRSFKCGTVLQSLSPLSVFHNFTEADQLFNLAHSMSNEKPDYIFCYKAVDIFKTTLDS